MKTLTTKQLTMIKENNNQVNLGVQKNLNGKKVQTNGLLIKEGDGIATFLCNDGDFVIDCKILK